METLNAVIAHRPQSPAAYLAHLALARVYASQEAPEAEAAYRAALALDDAMAVRLELARFLEAQGRPADAYVEYRQILGRQPDAFAAMRRTGQDPLAVARDLVAATYNSDALETLRDVDDPAAQPIRAQALAGLGRYAEAENSYRAWLADHPDDEAARLGLAGVLTSLERPDDALAIYRSVDNDDSRLAQADLLRVTDAVQALQLYQESPYPVAWWSATSLLEEQGRLTETLPIYARLARTDTPLADDAAYRLFVLGDRVGDAGARAEGGKLLDGFGLDWLALRAQGAGPSLAMTPPLASTAEEILAKADALDTIGRSDLARMELLLAARSRRTPEADLAVAQALAARGYLLDAQAVAEKVTAERPRASREFWELSYPRPYSDTVQAAAAEFGVDPFLIWAVMREESRFDPDALSFAGARGLMQLMPDTQDLDCRAVERLRGAGRRLRAGSSRSHGGLAAGLPERLL